jgi:DNA-binding response OmpR family regulator
VSETYHFADVELNDSKHSVKRGAIQADLTKTEYDLLKYLLKNRGIKLSREQILESIWGSDTQNIKIVDVYIRYLRAKIDDMFEEKLILTVWGFGYVLRGADFV